MKPEYIQNLREDFPDLISSETTIDATMPDAWREAVRALLIGMRELKFGRRIGFDRCRGSFGRPKWTTS